MLGVPWVGFELRELRNVLIQLALPRNALVLKEFADRSILSSVFDFLSRGQL